MGRAAIRITHDFLTDILQLPLGYRVVGVQPGANGIFRAELDSDALPIPAPDGTIAEADVVYIRQEPLKVEVKVRDHGATA